MLWPDIVGQEAALRFLGRALETGRLPGILLFTGPRGVGKRSAARALAKALLCRRSGTEGAHRQAQGALSRSKGACSACVSCREFEAGVHPDFLVPLVEDEKKTEVRDLTDEDRQITYVKTVAPLLERAHAAARGGRRCVLIPRADRMNERAQNALLKSLEEPPGGTVWLLTAEDPSRLLDTVRSRATRVRFGRVPTDLLARKLREDRALQEAEAFEVARAAEGSFTRAEELLSADLKEARAWLERTVLPRVGAGAGQGPALAGALVERAAAVRKRKAERKPARPASQAEPARRSALEVVASAAGLFEERLKGARASRPGDADLWARALEAVLASEAALRQNVRVQLALTVAGARLARR
jgi:DNA polymerase III delta prime subunit